MIVLVIEDNENKFNDISDALNRVLEYPTIMWKKSRNSGLAAIIENNVRGCDVAYDMVICDNYLPLYDDEFELRPMASNIIGRIRRNGLTDLPIIVCSSEEVDNCDYDYKIKYEPGIQLDDSFRDIFDKLNYQEFIRSAQNDNEVMTKQDAKVKNLKRKLG